MVFSRLTTRLVSQLEERIQDSVFSRRPRVDTRPPSKTGLKNIILFGETGVGKSSVINLAAGEEIAETSGGLDGCTLEATQYEIDLSEEVSVRIFDTVGLEEPELGVNSFMGAIEKAYQLVDSLRSDGGIDLLLFCVRGGRITAAMQRTYRLFYEVLCGGQVPLAMVVTNLELLEVMESWWGDNERAFHRYGIRPVAHACITAVPERIGLYVQKRAESQMTLRKMLLDTLSGPNHRPYIQELQGWFVAVAQLLRSFLVKGQSAKLKDLTKRLEKRCGLSSVNAEKLARMVMAGGLDPSVA